MFQYFEYVYVSKGGLLAQSTGVIYAFPAHSNEVLCVNTNPHPSKDSSNSPSVSSSSSSQEIDDSNDLWRISTIPIKRHDEDSDEDDLQYKWLGEF